MARAKNENTHEQFLCPVGRFFSKLERASGGKSGFAQHLSRSRAEFLKAVRSLIDEKIEDLEKEESPRKQKKSSRIEVE